MNQRSDFYFTIIGAFIFALSSSSYASGIYKITDQYGNTTYTNKPTRKANKFINKQNSSPTFSTQKPTLRSLEKKNYPKVNFSEQKQRNIKRKQILVYELDSETQLLENVLQTLHKTLQQQPIHYLPFHTDYHNILQLRKQAASHERNIEALKTELNNL